MEEGKNTDRKKVNVGLFASGSGSDANSIMTAWRDGFLPDVNIACLISTKENAYCLERAKAMKVKTDTIPRRHLLDHEFANHVKLTLISNRIKLVFLVGCVHKIPPVSNVIMYNIHPADPASHGGNTMYGLDVHRHVLREIRDQLIRGMKTIRDRFFTYPTVHEASEDYDQGKMLMRLAVEIPRELIEEFMSRRITLGKAAGKLQKIVLPYEWLMLPTAVKIAAKKLMDERGMST